MNYLGHAWLSFGHPEVLTGNLISDFVKGKARYNYPRGIQAGIELHRRIDCFTDAHRATLEARVLFQSHYRLYSAPIVDVLWDHFLACDQNRFEKDTLERFAREVYDALDAHAHHLPPRFLGLLPYMRQQNWLYNYRERWGTQRSLEGLSRRARYLGDTHQAFTLFEAHYDWLQERWYQLSAEVYAFAEEQFNELMPH